MKRLQNTSETFSFALSAANSFEQNNFHSFDAFWFIGASMKMENRVANVFDEVV